jgi:DNA polymerase-3 subunit epsilon
VAWRRASEPSAQNRSVGASLLRLFAGLAGFGIVVPASLYAVLGDAGWTGPLLAGALISAAVAATGSVVLLRLARPADRLGLDLAIIARDNVRHALRLGGRHWLGALVTGVEALRRRIEASEGETEHALAGATQRLREQTRRLEAVLMDLSEGAIICNMEHQVLLYNEAASLLLGPPAMLGLGRSLFTALTREPVLHALERCLQHHPTSAQGGSIGFVCGLVDGRGLLQARMAVVRGAEDAVSGYVLTFAEIGDQLAAAAQRDDLLQSTIEGLRRPLANLRAAAEALTAHPDLAIEQRNAFQTVIAGESETLSDRLEATARGYRELAGRQWPMHEIYFGDLVASLIRRLGTQPPRLTLTGLPQWLYGDSLSLLVLLEHLVRRLHEVRATKELDIAVTPSDGRASLDLLWSGTPIASMMLDEWLEQPLAGALGPITGRAVLQRHGSDAWSQSLRPGEALLRLPLALTGPVVPPPRRPRPQRPEFYDFDLLSQPMTTGPIAEMPLKRLSCVVFDLETTGLKPAEGDAIVAIGAVRVINGRILTMETFDRIVDPGRSIPAMSTQIHGITEAMVRDKPPLTVVLPQFRQFAGDAVLIAHNAAFDMSFLGQAGEECGLRFENPVLDTLLLSAWLDPAEPDHSLDATAARLGVPLIDRHTGLGDALATAAVLLRLIDRLDERGMTRLGEVMRATNMTAELRARRLEFQRRDHAQ